MRYRYFYQSKENKSCEGWIDAHDRNDAYNQLRKQGIKPYKLLGRNPLAWKRWAAIGVLGVATAVLAVVLMRKLADDRREAFAWEDRAQLYGDPSLLRELAADGWRVISSNTLSGASLTVNSSPIIVILERKA